MGAHRTDEQILAELLLLTNGELVYPTERTLRTKLNVDLPKIKRLLKYALRKNLIYPAAGMGYATLTEEDKLALQIPRRLHKTPLKVNDIEQPVHHRKRPRR